MLTLRMFLSSPSDVADERLKAREVVDRIARGPNWRERVHIDLVAWDDEYAAVPLDATRAPQQSVSLYAGKPSECDVTVVVLWGRIGTALPPDIVRDDGSPFPSGTVWEFEEARRAHRPVWVYRCQRKLLLDADDPELDAKRAQRAAVQRFFEEFVNADQSLDGGVNRYESVDDFAALFGQHLEAELRRRLDAQERAEAVRDATIGRAVLEQAVIDPRSVFARVDLSRFVGREWLLEAVDHFVNQQAQGVLLIEAPAGMGKSAFMAHLVAQRGYPCHFCELTPGVDGVSAAARSIAAQLILRWGLPHTLLSEVLPGYATRPDFLQRLLFDAAERRNRTAAGQPIILAIDALDEAGTPPGQNVLGLPTKLADGVFIVASLRPVPVAWRVEGPRRVLRLEASDHRNQADVGTYLRRAAERPAIAAELLQLGCSAQTFEERLLRISRGVWIYLHYVVGEIEAGNRSPLDLDSLPDGIWQYYAQYWLAWRRADPARWASLALPVLGLLAAAREDVTAEQIVALLPTTSMPAVSPLEISSVLESQWAPFLAHSPTARDGEWAFRLYHASLREFLSGRFPEHEFTSGELALGRELAQATVQAHRHIADTLSAVFQVDGAAALPAGRAVTGGLRSYGVHHLVAHLLASGLPERVGSLLRAARPVSVRRPFALEDRPVTRSTPLWFAENMALGNAEGFAGGVAQWLEVLKHRRQGAAQPASPDELFGRYVLSSLKRQADLVPPRLLQALCSAGLWTLKQALAHARLCVDEALRRDNLVALCPLLQREPDSWPFACDIARAMADPSDRIELFLALLEHAPAAERAQVAGELLQQARASQAGRRARSRALAMLSLLWDTPADQGLSGACLDEAPDLDEVLRCVQPAAHGASHVWWHHLLQRSTSGVQVAAILALAGDALRTSPVLESLARQWLSQGRLQRALVAAFSSGYEALAVSALARIVEHERPLQRGELAVALRALEMLPDDERLVRATDALIRLAFRSVRGEAHTDDGVVDAIAALKRPFVRAEIGAWIAAHDELATSPFGAIVQWLVGDDRARQAGPALTAIEGWSEAWRAYVVRYMGRHGAPVDRCLAAAASMRQPLFMAEALSSLAAALSRRARGRALDGLLRCLWADPPERDHFGAIAAHLEPWFAVEGAMVVDLLLNEGHFAATESFLVAAAGCAADIGQLGRIFLASVDLPGDGMHRVIGAMNEWAPDAMAALGRLALRSRLLDWQLVDAAAAALTEPAEIADLLSMAVNDLPPVLMERECELTAGIIAAGIARGTRNGARDARPVAALIDRLARDLPVSPDPISGRVGEWTGSASASIRHALAGAPLGAQSLAFIGELEAQGIQCPWELVAQPLLQGTTGLSTTESAQWIGWLSARAEQAEGVDAMRRALIYRVDPDQLDALVAFIAKADEWAHVGLVTACLDRLARLPDHAARRSVTQRLRLTDRALRSDGQRLAVQVLEGWWSGSARSWSESFEARGGTLSDETMALLMSATDPDAFAEILDRAPRWAGSGRCTRELARTFAELCADGAARSEILQRTRGESPYEQEPPAHAWLAWVLAWVPAHLVSTALEHHVARVSSRRGEQSRPDVRTELLRALGPDPYRWHHRHIRQGRADKLWRAGFGGVVEQVGAVEVDIFEGGNPLWLLGDRVEEVRSESMLLQLARSRFSPPGAEAVGRMAISFDERFGLRLGSVSEEFWPSLFRLLDERAVAAAHLVFGGLLVSWLAKASASLLLRAFRLALDCRSARWRATGVAGLVALMARRGQASPPAWETTYRPDIASALQQAGEASLFEAWLATGAERIAITESIAPQFVHATPGQRERLGLLGVALIGQAFAERVLEWMCVAGPAPPALLTAALAEARHCRTDLAWQLIGQQQDAALRVRLLIAVLSMRNDADAAQYAARLAAPRPDTLAAELAIAVLLDAHAGIARPAEALVPAAWACLLDHFDTRERDEVDALLMQVAPALHQVYGPEELARVASDLHRCWDWWP